MRVIAIAKWVGVACGLFLYSAQNAGAEETFQFGFDCLNCYPAPANLPDPMDYAKSSRKGTAQRKGAQPASIQAKYPSTRR